jgi:2-succinyl-5-enolpyruvyl-6-hydroxy-3-cyclohexene-1-carboxylate synthase
VHINVPISEPLFCFDTPTLPEERVLRPLLKQPSHDIPTLLLSEISSAQRPLIVIGQMAKGAVSAETMEILSRVFTVFSEPLSNNSSQQLLFDEAIRCSHDADEHMPNIIIYIGDTLVSKSARRFLRKSRTKTYLITTDASHTPDPTMWLEGVIECADVKDIDYLLLSLATACHINDNNEREQFNDFWRHKLAIAARHAATFMPPFTQMAVVKQLEEKIGNGRNDIHTHYANSTAIRLANIYAKHYVWCNRGVNGIEGCISTAAGYSLLTEGKVVCVTGDLSFFYDQNALWNQNIDGRLRIVLLNNGGGGIFRQLKGLQESPAAESYIEASHSTSAQGICQQNGIDYASARNMGEMLTGIDRLLTQESARPMLLEVFTNAQADAAALGKYYSELSKKQ